MVFRIGVELSYLPWEEPANHGALPWSLRLLSLARANGWVLHAFATAAVFRALPAWVDAFSDEGHPVDWLATGDFAVAQRAAKGAGLELKGFIGNANGHSILRWHVGENDLWLNPAAEFVSDPSCTGVDQRIRDLMGRGLKNRTFRDEA